MQQTGCNIYSVTLPKKYENVIFRAHDTSVLGGNGWGDHVVWQTNDLIFDESKPMYEVSSDANYSPGEWIEGKIVTLVPETDADLYEWNTGELTRTKTIVYRGGDMSYSCKVYETDINVANNLMRNGDFETLPEDQDDTHPKQVGFYTEYKNYGTQYLFDYPTNPYAYQMGLGDHQQNTFAVVCNRIHFIDQPSPVIFNPFDSYCLYIDGFNIETVSCAYRATSADNPDLKLEKGETYVFSFYAVSVSHHNYSPAEIQFQVSYKNKSGVYEQIPLGDAHTIDASEDRPWQFAGEIAPEEWTKYQVYFYAPESSDDVAIELHDNMFAADGNDFCLDNICFQKVTDDKKKFLREETFSFSGPTQKEDIYASICESDSYIWEDEERSRAVETSQIFTYDKTYTTEMGCDGVKTLHLTVNPTYTNLEEEAYICPGSDTLWNGILCNEEKDYIAPLKTVHGCDSIVTLHLHFWPAYTKLEEEAYICEGSDTLWNGILCNEEKDYIAPLKTIHGCDSIVTLHLHLWSSYTKLEEEAYICPGSDTLWNGILCNEEKDYIAPLKTVHGCDSIVTLHLHFWPSYPNLEETAYIYEGSDTTWNDLLCNEEKDYTAHLYTIHGCDSIVTLHLTIVPYPDNVDDATDCMVPPSTNVWSIRRSATSTIGNVDGCSTMFSGDIDDDGNIEILAPIITESVKFAKIAILDSDAKTKNIIDVPTCSAFINVAMAKVKISDSEYKTLIFFLAYDRYLYAYDPNGSQYWKSDQQFTSHSGEAVAIASLSLADFNHDGWTEIYIGPEIYDAATGKRLGKYNGNKGHSDRAWKASRQSYQSVVADVIGDDKLELILGNTACSVNINSRTDESQNSITAVNSVPAANMKMEDNSTIPSTDGHTLLADMDGDGKIDVVVMHIDKTNRVIYVYVWNPRTGSMICTKKITNAAEFGTPNVGDIDHDGNLELNFIIGTYDGETTDANDRIYSLKYDKSTHILDVFWTLHHDDASGSTGLSLFDFNQDGTMEIVYRDCEHLRIINGSKIHHLTGNPVATPYDLANIPCTSGTGVEYPIIADIDKDGEAEIIVTDDDQVAIFKSNLAPWAPARSIWNQFAYNITNVNEDLTIPTYLYNNAQIFTDASSTTRQPFNNFLAQATTINTQGVPFIAAADVNVSASATTIYENDSIKINISFCNQGDLQVNAPYSITVYKNAYHGSVLFIDKIKSGLPIGDCLSHQVGFPIADVCSDKDINTLVVAINDDGHGIAQHGNQQAECDTTNNTLIVTLPTDFRNDTTKYTPVICASELPYTFAPTGTIFPVGTTSGRTIIAENNKYGCDSIIAIDLTVNPILTGDTIVYLCEGSDTLWNGILCNEEKDYIAPLKTVHGCDSIVTLHLHFWPAYTDLEEEAYICEGSDTLWNDIRCNEEKDYTAHLHTIHGCDSIVTLHLHFWPAYTDLEEEAYICEGSDTLWNDIRCNEEKDYTAHLHTIHGCDSIVTLHLHFWPSYTDLEETAYIYEGGDTLWNDILCNEEKDYTAYLHTVHGCDSIVTLHLDITDKLIVYPVVDTTTCEGVPVDFYGKTYDTSNSYKTDRISGQGTDPDTIYTLNLTVFPTYLDLEEEAYICEGSDTLWNDIRCNEEKDYIAPLKTIHGCDSIVTLHLHFWPSYTDLEETAYIYEGSDTIWNGIRCNEEKDYTAYLHTVHGCDSIVTLHLDIREIPEPGVLRVKMCPGESMVWCDETIYPTEENNEFPCDIDESHTQTLIVEFYPIPSLDERTTDTTVLSKELPFEWEGDLYTLPGHYEKIKTTDAGDESCIYTVYLDLTILKQTELISVDTTTCEGTPVTFYGKTYDTSGSYKTDTIKGTGIDPDTVYTLNLTVYPTYNMREETATIIDGETYTWNGTDYDIAGVYPKTLETIHKCDSNVTLNLTVLDNIVENVSFNIAEQCAGEGALEIVLQHTGYLTDAQLTFSEDAIQAGFENGTYPIKNDTVIVPYNVKAGIFSVGIDLWFHSRLKYSGNAPFTLLFPSSVLEQGWMDAIFVLTHNYNGGYNFTAFQWYKKGQKLVGETGPYLYQPLEVGAEYSAMLTEQSGLQLMTCPIIIEEHTDISLYPTVVTRKEMIRVSVTQNARLTMYSLMGEKVSTYALLHGDTQIEAPGTQGIYLAEVVLESGTRKVIKIMVR
jgi:hypothetical protein